MGGNGFTYMLAYLVSSVSVLAALRYGLPSKIVISGSQRNIIAARAVTLIEQSSIGFRYTKAADNQRWKMPGPDIYPWDPSVRIEYGADKISITGPGCTMSLLLVKLRRE